MLQLLQNMMSVIRTVKKKNIKPTIFFLSLIKNAKSKQ
jgi:hypothetical protein